MLSLIERFWNPLNTAVTVLLAESANLGRISEWLSGEPFTWVYLGKDITDFQRIRCVLADQGTYLDTTLQFHQASESLRQPYLEYLYDIGRSLNALSWWINPTSGRSGYTSKTFQQTCLLRVGLDLVENWDGPGRLVIIADELVCRTLDQNLPKTPKSRIWRTRRIRIFPFPVFRDIFVLLAHRAYFILRETQRVLHSRRLVPHPFVSNEPTTLLICWMTQSNMGEGEDFHKSFFGDLATHLGALGNQVAIVPFVLRDVPYKDSIVPLQDKSLPLALMHRHLNFFDVISTAIRSCSKPIRPHSIPLFSGMTIETLIKEELNKYWLTNWAADTLLITAVIRRWACLDLTITRIIYIYENQPWERALCWEARRSLPETALVGYQHARAPRLALNFYLAPGGECKAPLPDLVVTVGEHTAKLFKADGYDSDRVRVGGALPYLDLFEIRSQVGRSTVPQHSPMVLVATSNGLEEATELVDLASHLFDQDEGVEVVLKCHPLMSYQQIESVLGPQLPDYVRLSDRPITELMLQSSVLVYSGSTAAIQALALGVPLIHLRTQFDLDLDPLDAVPHLRMEAVGLESLQEKVRWLLDHRDEYIAQHKEEWDRFADEFYGPVTEDAYRAFLEPKESLAAS